MPASTPSARRPEAIVFISQHCSTNPAGYFLPRTAGAWLACGFLSLALLHLLCCSPAATQQAVLSPLRQYINNTYSFVASV